MRRSLLPLLVLLLAGCGSSSSPAPTATLSVAVVGSGTVTSSPTGVTCGSSCSAAYAQNAAVTLTAAPGPWSVFAGWSGGGCGGAPRCVLSMATAQSVTATFRTGGYTTWDPAWSPAGVTASNGNLSVSGNSAGTKTVRAVAGVSTGKWYWEVRATGGDGVTDQGGIGILEHGAPNDSYIGAVPSGLSFGYGGFPQYWMDWAGATLTATPPPATSYVKAGITYMFALDMDTGRFWAGQDGAWYGGGDPATAAGPVATGLSGMVHPGVTLYASSNLSFTANFGASAFAHPVPTGFSAGLHDLPTAWDPSWSPAGVTASSGNLSVSGNSAGVKAVRTVVGRSSGQWYWEVAATGGDGVTDEGGIGILERGAPNDNYLGAVPSGLSFGYGGFPQYWMDWAGATLTATPPPATSYVKVGITYMFALDLDTGRFWAGQDGAWYGGGDPATATSPVATGLSGTVHPGVVFYPSSSLAFTANFGASAFARPVPAGFAPGLF
jgi:hypothetical protein